MAKKARDLDWYTVKYKDIYTVIAVVILLVVVGGGGFAYWRWAGNPEGKAERTLAKAKKLLDTFGADDLKPVQKSTLEQARKTYALAEEEFRQRRFQPAFQKANDVVETLSDLKEQISVFQKFAMLQEVEGQVEVKKSGQHLFAGGKENMPLESGDIVKTGKDGSCRIKYHTGTIHLVNPDTLTIIQITLNASGGSKIQATVNEGTVEQQTPDTLKDNEESILAGKNTKIMTPADSRAAVTQDKATGTTRTAVLQGSGTVEGPQGQKQVMAQGTAIVATEVGLGATETLSSPPRPKGPMDGEILRPASASPPYSVRLEWEGGSGSGTRVQVSAKALFTKVLGEKLVSEKYITLDGLTAGTFYWRVRAQGDDDKTYWSRTQKFRIMAPLQKPTIKRDIKLVVESTPIGDGAILQGSTDPGVAVSVNNLEIPVNADGSFNKIVLFSDAGTQQILVRAFDDQGNEKSVPIRIQRSSE